MYPALAVSCSKHSDWVLLQRNEPNLLQLQSLAARAKKMLKEKKAISLLQCCAQWLTAVIGRPLWNRTNALLFDKFGLVSLALCLAEVLSGSGLVDGVNLLSGALVGKFRGVYALAHSSKRSLSW